MPSELTAAWHSAESSPDWPSLQLPFVGSTSNSQLRPSDSPTTDLVEELFTHTDSLNDTDIQEQSNESYLRSPKDSSMSEDSLKDEDSAFDFLNE